MALAAGPVTAAAGTLVTVTLTDLAAETLPAASAAVTAMVWEPFVRPAVASEYTEPCAVARRRGGEAVVHRTRRPPTASRPFPRQAVPATLTKPDTLAALVGAVMAAVGRFKTARLKVTGVETTDEESVALIETVFAPFLREAVASAADHFVVARGRDVGAAVHRHGRPT